MRVSWAMSAAFCSTELCRAIARKKRRRANWRAFVAIGGLAVALLMGSRVFAQELIPPDAGTSGLLTTSFGAVDKSCIHTIPKGQPSTSTAR